MLSSFDKIIRNEEITTTFVLDAASKVVGLIEEVMELVCEIEGKIEVLQDFLGELKTL